MQNDKASLRSLIKIGIDVDYKDKKRLSPFGYEHINIVGNYSFEQAYKILKGHFINLLPMDKKLFGI